jgi:hypothetical protein
MNQCVDLPAPVAAEGGLDDLNRWLGRREAFGLMAGRCSAADVECMRRIRDGKLYLGHAGSWADFCVKHFHMSKSNANRLIGLLEKYGAEYFHIAQIARISSSDYRAIAPAVSADGITWDGEIIPLTPENSERIAAAVQALRDAHPGTSEPPAKDPLAELEAAGNRLLKQFRDLSSRRGRSDPYLAGLVGSLQRKVELLRREVG